MKAQRYLIIVLAAVSVQSAHGAFTETQDIKTKIRQTLTQVTATVTTWWNYWTGAPQSAPQPGQTVAAPQPNSAAPMNPAVKNSNSLDPAPKTATAPAPEKGTPVSAVAPRGPETAEQARLRQQPIYQEKKTNSSLDDIKAVKDAVAKTPVLTVAKPGVQGTSQLPKSKSGVPLADFQRMHQAKSVPRLDIGTENEISAKDFAYGNLNWNENKGNDMDRLPLVPSIYSHDLSVALRIKAEPVLGPKNMDSGLKQAAKIVNQATIDAITYKLEVGEEAKPLPYRAFTEEELKMATALILYDRGSHCHMVMGLFHQLASAPKTKVEATYHLGACAQQLQLHQAAFDNLSFVVTSGDKDYAASALEILAKDLPAIYEKDFFKMGKNLANFKAMINDKNRDNITYRMAKGAFRLKDYKTSSVYADQVSESSDLYTDARVLSAMNSFAVGEKVRALKKLEEVWKSLESRKAPNANIRALTAVNIARMYFANHKFDKALDFYMQVPKDHPFWVQALIEQGWTQLALDDFSGAIGNMYSLHSPYFKAVYQPESFVVRTIGYLNICQYGDAYKTLTFLEKDYRDWHDKLDRYLQTRSEPGLIYRTVKNYIQGKSSNDLEGVPYQIWREMARQKDFLNLQTALNEKQDEVGRFEGVNEKIKKEKAAIRTRSEASKRRFDELRAKIDHLKVDKTLVREMPQWQASLNLEKDLIVGLRYQLAVLENGRQGYLEFQTKSQNKLDAETAALNLQAGAALLARAKDMSAEMSRILENNEFLRYEVFSGSGENIRYQVAGGETGAANRVPAHLKPTKLMNWQFDGEFWEDEIGSYRSSLQNNCPNTGRGSAQALNH